MTGEGVDGGESLTSSTGLAFAAGLVSQQLGASPYRFHDELFRAMLRAYQSEALWCF